MKIAILHATDRLAGRLFILFVTMYFLKNLDKSNLHGEYFKCTICGYENNADINAAMNILNRFELGFCST